MKKPPLRISPVGELGVVRPDAAGKFIACDVPKSTHASVTAAIAPHHTVVEELGAVYVMREGREEVVCRHWLVEVARGT